MSIMFTRAKAGARSFRQNGYRRRPLWLDERSDSLVNKEEAAELRSELSALSIK